MPVDRPRRALLEEPDDVESYVAKRSLGFTQADSGDRFVVRPARAARALEPSAIGAHVQTAEHDHLKVSGSPARRALPAESLSWHLDEEEPAPTGSRPLVGAPSLIRSPRNPARSVLSQPARAAGDSGTASAATQWSLAIFRATEHPLRLGSSARSHARGATFRRKPPPPVQSEQGPAYWPTPSPISAAHRRQSSRSRGRRTGSAPSPISAAQPAAVQSEQEAGVLAHPVTDLGCSTGGSPLGAEAGVPRPIRQSSLHQRRCLRRPTVERTNPPLRRAPGVGQITQSAGQVTQSSVEITHAVPIRPASRVGVADRLRRHLGRDRGRPFVARLHVL